MPSVLLSTCLGVLICLQMAADTAVPSPEQPKAKETETLDRIAVIGASASSGFGILLRYVNEKNMLSSRTICMREIVEEVVTANDTKLIGDGDGWFFMSPERTGTTQIKAAIEFQPTLVIAIDYPLWFGYGNRDLEGQLIPRGNAGRQARLELLETGLKQLDTFSCPIIIGDFPDMSDAIGYMLSANQVPSPDTLVALNERLKTWASKRPNVHVLEMSKLLDNMRSDASFEIGRQEWPTGSKSRFMQNDNLHPTLDGLIVLVQESGTLLSDHHEDVDLSNFDFDLIQVRDRLYETRRPDGMTSKPYTGRN